ncbi:signal recognition particle-docking protein FtsY [Polymorphobacter sp.]|uniref:signal recognition particle-docking protein FtsY n=1 Tax=Polymorphobacter sp. TaxID=1909290 RepID=UPI003F725A74
MSWLDRLKTGLSRSSTKLADNLAGLASGTAPLDEERLDAIEEALITADLGPAVAARIRDKLAGPRFARGIDEAGLKAAVSEDIADILAPYMKPLAVTAFPRPHVILVVGVNGVGKTTTIAKLARRLTEQDYSVMLAAGDTFRAAAIAQLQIWADRVGVPLVSGEQGADAAGLTYQALEKAQAAGTDVLIIDTAGRLQNKAGLMDELAKIRRVLQKRSPASPHDTLLVLDATTGQNALSQIEVFKDVARVTGLVITKLDGSARGGVIVAAAERFHLPIHAIGIGEGMDDLRPFDARDFARAITGEAS